MFEVRKEEGERKGGRWLRRRAFWKEEPGKTRPPHLPFYYSLFISISFIFDVGLYLWCRIIS